eukprot:2106945-Prymnesium_polylepis.1
MGRPSAASARICAPRARSRAPSSSSRPASPQARTAPRHTGAIVARRSAGACPRLRCRIAAPHRHPCRQPC